MTEFTPPPFEHPRAPEWATFVPARRPQFKVHAGDRGRAVNAVMLSVYGPGARGGIIYRLVDGKWVKYADVPRGAERGTLEKYIEGL